MKKITRIIELMKNNDRPAHCRPTNGSGTCLKQVGDAAMEEVSRR